MQCMYQKSRPSSSSRGFTLVEILVIAPLIIITVAIFVALIITITGDVLRTKGSNDLIYNTQDTLNRIEQDANLAVEFRATSYTPLSPNGITGTTNFDGSSAFTVGGSSPARLILRSLSTDKQPLSETRQLIYKSPPSCSGSTVPYTHDIIYFIKGSSLWRRVLIGDSTLAGTNTAGAPCATPWQIATCSPGYTSTVCKAEDSELMTDIQSVTVEYFKDDGTSATSAEASIAVAVRVTIQTSNTVAGRASTSTNTLYARRNNAPISDL